jgi:hypothetical protein
MTKEQRRKKEAIGNARAEENGIEDGPNPVLDAMAIEIAEDLAAKHGREKIERLFPEMAKLLP